MRPVCKATDRPVIRQLFCKEFYGNAVQPYPDEGLWEIYDSMEPQAEEPFGAYLVSWLDRSLFLMEVHPAVQMDLPKPFLSQPGTIGVFVFYFSYSDVMNLPALRACIGCLLAHPSVERILTTFTQPAPNDPRIQLLKGCGFRRSPKSPGHSAVLCCTTETFSTWHTNAAPSGVNRSYILS